MKEGTEKMQQLLKQKEKLRFIILKDSFYDRWDQLEEAASNYALATTPIDQEMEFYRNQLGKLAYYEKKRTLHSKKKNL